MRSEYEHAASHSLPHMEEARLRAGTRRASSRRKLCCITILLIGAIIALGMGLRFGLNKESDGGTPDDSSTVSGNSAPTETLDDFHSLKRPSKAPSRQPAGTSKPSGSQFPSVAPSSSAGEPTTDLGNANMKDATDFPSLAPSA